MACAGGCGPVCCGDDDAPIQVGSGAPRILESMEPRFSRTWFTTPSSGTERLSITQATGRLTPQSFRSGVVPLFEGGSPSGGGGQWALPVATIVGPQAARQVSDCGSIQRDEGYALVKTGGSKKDDEKSEKNIAAAKEVAHLGAKALCNLAAHQKCKPAVKCGNITYKPPETKDACKQGDAVDKEKWLEDQRKAAAFHEKRYQNGEDAARNDLRLLMLTVGALVLSEDWNWATGVVTVWCVTECSGTCGAK